jgi:hypothetical protein
LSGAITIVFKFQVSDQTSTVAASFTVTEGSSTTAKNNVVEKAQSPAANVYQGFPVDVERLLKMFPCELSKIKAKVKVVIEF